MLACNVIVPGCYPARSLTFITSMVNVTDEGATMDEDAAAMAAAMGFSSFGDQRSSKKRKHNDDAFSSFSSAAAAQGPGKGANAVALGIRTNRDGHVQDSLGESNKETAVIGNGNEQSGLESTAKSNMGKGKGKEKKKSNASVPSGLAGFLARGKELKYEQETTAPSTQQQSLGGVGSGQNSAQYQSQSLQQNYEQDGSLPQLMHPLPGRPNVKPSSSSFQQGRQSDPAETLAKSNVADFTRQDLYVLSKGITNANGDTVYFAPSFIEDPWQRLPKEPPAPGEQVSAKSVAKDNDYITGVAAIEWMEKHRGWDEEMKQQYEKAGALIRETELYKQRFALLEKG
jgi:hypothetical protein